MDIREIKIKVLAFRKEIILSGIYPDLFVLFGSYYKGNYRTDSDIDLAIISRDLGKDRFKESTLLNYIASKEDSRFEIIPVGLSEYLDPLPISPIIAEIKANGTPLF
ncbi:MAG: nucleotidyltransferase domain-containing protein [Oligoflexia bacterium]|nr:nucleotidyltransferase domain-containing protein [Oligoflexia bacterium]